MTRSKSTLPTALQQKIYNYIVEFKRDHDGNSPSIAEIMKAMDVHSSSVIRYHLDALERLGMIRCGDARTARMISVVGGQWTTPAYLTTAIEQKLAAKL